MERIIDVLIDRTFANDNTWGMNLESWDWHQGVGLFGAACAYNRTHNKRYLELLLSWYNKNIGKAHEKQTINSTAPFLTVLELYSITREEKYLAQCLKAADWIITEAALTIDGGLEHTVISETGKFSNQLWSDTLFMACVFLARLSAVTGEQKYGEFAAKQLVIHLGYLKDKDSNLFFHAWNGETRGHMSAVLWSRANAWITLSIFFILDAVKDFTNKEFVLRSVQKQAEAYKREQLECGGFRTALGIDDDRNYVEISAVAGIACGLKKLAETGILTNDYETVYKKAEALVIRNIDANGEVKNVSTGTPVMNSAQEYFGIGITPTLYGQGLALMMLCL